jgi:hypothetical protein
MHTWGDDFDFSGVENAAEFIAEYIAKYGRIIVMQYKEKFGTVRVYCSVGFNCFYSLLNPRKIYINPKWPYLLDLKISAFLSPLMNFVLRPLQKYVYRRAYKLAIKKYPHLKEEILYSCDYPEFLGGLIEKA